MGWLAQRVGALRAREADRRMRAELEQVFAERNRLAKEMARMVEPIVQIPHLYQGSTLVAAGSDTEKSETRAITVPLPPGPVTSAGYAGNSRPAFDKRKMQKQLSMKSAPRQFLEPCGTIDYRAGRATKSVSLPNTTGLSGKSSG